MTTTAARRLLLLLTLMLAACTAENDNLAGEDLADEIGCLACHTDADTALAPTLHGIWGDVVVLDDGRNVTVDEGYVRDSITAPQDEIVAGHDGRMPTFDLTDSEIERLVEYVRSLG